MKILLSILALLLTTTSLAPPNVDNTSRISELKLKLECLEMDKVFNMRPDSIDLEILKLSLELQKLQ